MCGLAQPKKRQKNARSLLSSCALCRSKSSPPKKIATFWNAKKRERLISFFSSYQYVVQFQKTRQKKWRMWSARASLFFSPYISMLCSSKRPATKKKCDVLKCKKKSARSPSFPHISTLCSSRQKEWRIRSARTSLFFIILFKCKNGGNRQPSLVGQAVWRFGLLSESFWVRNLMVPNLKKKQNAKKRVENCGIMDLCSKLCHGFRM